MAPRFRVCGNRGASDGLDCHHTKSSGLGGGVPDLGLGCRGPCFGGCGSSARRSDTGAVGYASQLLSRLGLESNLAQCADGVCAEATRDRNAAQSLTDQENPAAGSREQRKAVAPRTLNSARIAATAAAARAGSAGKAPSAWWASPTSGQEGLPVIPCRLSGSAESRWGSPGRRTRQTASPTAPNSRSPSTRRRDRQMFPESRSRGGGERQWRRQCSPPVRASAPRSQSGRR